MSIDILAQVVADAFLFLELSDDDVVDPDAAVAQEELLGHRLESLDPPEKQALAGAIERLAADQTDGRARRLLEQLPADLGLVDRDDA